MTLREYLQKHETISIELDKHYVARDLLAAIEKDGVVYTSKVSVQMSRISKLQGFPQVRLEPEDLDKEVMVHEGRVLLRTPEQSWKHLWDESRS